MIPTTHKDLLVYLFTTYADFETWLSEHYEQPDSIWILFAKKNSGQTTLSYEEAREVAIRYGWIDGLINKWDESFYLLKFSKRRKQSKWSQINREIVEQLVAEDRMTPMGLAEVDRAKADGRWEQAYAPPSTMTIPEWFLERIEKDALAKKAFEKLSKSEIYSIAYNLRTAKREETTQRRADKYMEEFRAKGNLME